MTTPRVTKYPGIYRAALEIALDNGGINRSRPVEQQRREFARLIERQPQEILPSIDAWLAGLPDTILETVCAGEDTEMMEALDGSPPFTHQLLNDYFNEVC